MRTRLLSLTLAASCVVALGLHGGCAAQRRPDGGTTPSPSAPAQTAAAPKAPTTAADDPAPNLALVTAQGRVTFEAPRGEVVIKAEVVTTPAGRQQGLMYRRSMAPDAGMVFVFPEEEVQSFWMRNTHVALDIIFVNEKLQVVGVASDATPRTTSPRTVGKPSKFVVEVVAGLCAASGIRAGTKVRFEGIPTSANE